MSLRIKPMHQPLATERRRLKSTGGFYETMSAEIGQSAPDFTLPDQSGNQVSLSQFTGQKNVVLSFHVFDFTGG
jgi:cytochrome oxidase Cu insertion factor (SCO1/SenC/PrrC family)